MKLKYLSLLFVFKMEGTAVRFCAHGIDLKKCRKNGENYWNK